MNEEKQEGKTKTEEREEEYIIAHRRRHLELGRGLCYDDSGSTTLAGITAPPAGIRMDCGVVQRQDNGFWSRLRRFESPTPMGPLPLYLHPPLHLGEMAVGTLQE
jgi:hypothetical protein